MHWTIITITQESENSNITNYSILMQPVTLWHLVASGVTKHEEKEIKTKSMGMWDVYFIHGNRVCYAQCKNIAFASIVDVCTEEILLVNISFFYRSFSGDCFPWQKKDTLKSANAAYVVNRPTTKPSASGKFIWFNLNLCGLYGGAFHVVLTRMYSVLSTYLH